MLTFKRDMDEHSLDILRNNKRIGYLHWHSTRSPRIVLCDTFEYLSINEMKECIAEHEKRTLLQSMTSE